jgi:branched-chain amino acid transport system ATP-binding protein
MSDEVLLRLDGVSRSFGGLMAVKHVTFAVRPGELVGLIGPNGAGKTTLLNLISGLVRPSRGEIRFRDVVVNGMAPHRIARLGVGRTFQVTRPFKGMTVLENALLGALFVHDMPFRDVVRRAEEVLDFLRLGEKRHWPVSSLTLPDVKRLEVAKALAMDPQLLLLDEVMAGLNPRELDEVMAFVASVNARGVTVLMIEHVMRAIMGICQRVVVLHQGEVIADDVPKTVANDARVIEAYLGQRFARSAERGRADR